MKFPGPLTAANLIELLSTLDPNTRIAADVPGLTADLTGYKTFQFPFFPHPVLEFVMNVYCQHCSEYVDNPSPDCPAHGVLLADDAQEKAFWLAEGLGIVPDGPLPKG